MGQWSYFATTQTATAVESVLGPVALTQPDEEELVVARGTSLDIFRCEEHRLVHICSGCTNETVCCLLKASSARSGYNLLVLITVSLQVLVTRFDNDAKVMQLLGAADAGSMVQDATAHPAACSVSAQGWRIAVYLYSSILAILDLTGLEAAFDHGGVVDLKSANKMFYVDMSEQIACLDFLLSDEDSDGPSERATLVALHAREDSYGGWEDGPKVLCIHCIDLHKKSSKAAAKPELPFARGLANVPGRQYVDATLMACVPPNTAGEWAAQGAVLVVGAGFVRLYDPKLQPLSSLRGIQGTRSPELIVQCLGISAPASGIGTWKYGEYAFIGSRVTDSEVLHLWEPKAEAPATTSTTGQPRPTLADAFEVTDRWTNLGPITDFCTKEDTDGLTNQIITCSGAGEKSGSLRFIEMGIPVEELGSSEGFGNVLGMWALGSHFLVLTRSNSTEVLRISECQSGDGDFSLEVWAKTAGLQLEEETLLCCGVCDRVVIQVTQSGVWAMNSENLAPVSEWTAGAPFLTASEMRGGQGVMLATQKGDVYAIDFQEGSQRLISAGEWQLRSEPSCLAATTPWCAAGLWSDELVIWERKKDFWQSLTLPTLPRSLAFLRFSAAHEPELRLFAGLCDGRVSVVTVDGAWRLQHTVAVGLQPVQLLPFPGAADVETDMGPKLPWGQPCEGAQEQDRLLAISGKGSILQAQSQRVLRWQICLPSMSHAAFFSHGFGCIQHCMAFISHERLLLALLRLGQRIDVRTVPLPQAPRRICYHTGSRICVVGCSDLPSISTPDMPRTRSRANVQFVHSETTDLLGTMTLGQDEMVASVVAVTFAGDCTEYIAVGTAIVLDNEPEPSRGQVLLLALRGDTSVQTAKCGLDEEPPFRLVCTLEVPGAVYTLVAFQQMLLGAVNNRLQLWNLKSGQLVEVCRYSAGVIVLDVQVMGSHILVGDIMRSVNLFRFEDSSLKMVAYDEISAWSTSVDMLSDNHFLCADDGGNLLALSRGELTASVGDVRILERVGRIHTGEFMNRFRPGFFALRVNEPRVKTTIWASASGAFGVIVPVNCEKTFMRLLMLQDCIRRELVPMLTHSTLRGGTEYGGFLNGDLLERFLDIPEGKQKVLALEVADAGLTTSENPVLELIQDVEGLSQMY
ncbi:unnamed protein product [Durusdinium trenchii]|uniref:DNA damage-binding protein 1 n=1 Tax=Durusdinium trenchii TaxID=1381693 RepID=A0ABP0MEF5_9DINO